MFICLWTFIILLCAYVFETEWGEDVAIETLVPRPF